MKDPANRNRNQPTIRYDDIVPILLGLVTDLF